MIIQQLLPMCMTERKNPSDILLQYVGAEPSAEQHPEHIASMQAYPFLGRSGSKRPWRHMIARVGDTTPSDRWLTLHCFNFQLRSQERESRISLPSPTSASAAGSSAMRTRSTMCLRTASVSSLQVCYYASWPAVKLCMPTPFFTTSKTQS
jgi:hypothetical protein